MLEEDRGEDEDELSEVKEEIEQLKSSTEEKG
jgi:hypothetical protein